MCLKNNLCHDWELLPQCSNRSTSPIKLCLHYGWSARIWSLNYKWVSTIRIASYSWRPTISENYSWHIALFACAPLHDSKRLYKLCCLEGDTEASFSVTWHDRYVTINFRQLYSAQSILFWAKINKIERILELFISLLGLFRDARRHFYNV